MEIVVKSYKKCGISNAVDGTDDFLWNGMDNDDMEADDDDNVDDPYDDALQEAVWDELSDSEGNEDFNTHPVLSGTAILCC